ncbi:MAG: hypothetical protein RL238_3718 [Actinomycetota bacterium]|jgi:uncharacterized flavoprotein (TIGR03862 family)
MTPAPLQHAVVVGGGPGGLMAAEVLAAGGLGVTVVDHMPSVGRKFLLAGRSGLNLTHSEPMEQMVARYGAQAGRLEPALRAFDAAALREWSAGLGEPTFVGTSGRVFPQSLRATSLLRAWLRRLGDLGVAFETRTRWIGWDVDALVVERNGERRALPADVTVLALGGASWPRVGSDGGWVPVLRAEGVEVHDLRPANCGIELGWSTTFADRHAGQPLKNVELSIGGVTARGDAVITATGMEAGPIYSLSAPIRDALDRGMAVLAVDLQPDLDEAQVAARLRRARPKDSLSSTLKRTMGFSATTVAWLREVVSGPLPSEPVELAALVKEVPVHVQALVPLDRAISSAGGVAMHEVDDTFMLHRRPNTYVVGEMLDWEAPTGGFLLQATFATAVTAARAAVARAR